MGMCIDSATVIAGTAGGFSDTADQKHSARMDFMTSSASSTVAGKFFIGPPVSSVAPAGFPLGGLSLSICGLSCRARHRKSRAHDVCPRARARCACRAVSRHCSIAPRTPKSRPRPAHAETKPSGRAKTKTRPSATERPAEGRDPPQVVHASAPVAGKQGSSSEPGPWGRRWKLAWERPISRRCAVARAEVCRPTHPARVSP